jgi:hypothetical protein
MKGLYYHSEIVKASDYSDIPLDLKFLPSLAPNWDHTPRSGRLGQVIVDSSPDLFAENLKKCIARVSHHEPEEKIVFIKAWNEWAEGNFLEPSALDGRQYLLAVDECLDK